MSDDEDVEARLDAIERQLHRLNTRFEALAEDYTDLRYEVNELAEKLERRT